MPRGRRPNQHRVAARLAGEKFYDDPAECDFDGTHKRYVSNAACVACAIARGKARYASLDEDAIAVLKARDHDRYVQRLGKEEAP